jgi:antitoxin component YwqK of YwqJK toxin-antitoxin module
MKYILSLVCLIVTFGLNAQSKVLKTYYDNGKLKTVYTYQDASNYSVENFCDNAETAYP